MSQESKSKEANAKAIEHIFTSYADFFEHLSFKRGWDTPVFTLDEVRELFNVSAAIVVFIRRKLDENDSNFKIRQVGGASQEFLWYLQKNRLHPPSSSSSTPDQVQYFVCHMIHYTLRDASGYVEGLTEEKVNSYIETFKKNAKSVKEKMRQRKLMEETDFSKR